jgi:PEGA domain
MRDLLDDEDITQLRELPLGPAADEAPTRVRTVPSTGPRSGIRPAAPRLPDPDLDDAVVGVLEDICGKLGEPDDSSPLIELEALAAQDEAELLEELSDDDRPATLPPPSMPPGATALDSVPELIIEDDEDDWTPTRDMFVDALLGDLDLPEPPPSTPELLAGALVYADDDLDLPGYRFPEPDATQGEELDVARIEAPPPSLRPISRTSIPPYEPPRRSGWWIAAAAVVLSVVGAWQLAALRRGAEAQLADTSVAPAAAQVRQIVNATSGMHGVSMRVDGEPRGVLPLSVDDLEPGEHTFRFEAPGYVPLERHVTLVRGESVDLEDIVLEQKPAKVHVELSPSNAFLLVGKPGAGEGKRYAGPWPRIVEIAPGQYDVMAFRGGYRSAAMRIDVKPGSRVETVRIDLSRDDIYEE